MKVCILTGASCCGKTTMIKHFEALGYPVMHEASREILSEGKLHPARNPFKFQAEVAKRHLAREEKLRAENRGEIAFLDRGVYDGLAFSKHFGLKKLPAQLNRHIHYDVAFFLEALPMFEKDAIRVEADKSEALKIQKLIRKVYQKKNVPCVDVPVMSVEQRAEFILNQLRRNADKKETLV